SGGTTAIRQREPHEHHNMPATISLSSRLPNIYSSFMGACDPCSCRFPCRKKSTFPRRYPGATCHVGDRCCKERRRSARALGVGKVDCVIVGANLLISKNPGGNDHAASAIERHTAGKMFCDQRHRPTGIPHPRTCRRCV